MASGWGFVSGRSRCYNFWQEYFDCYASADHPKQCSLELDNYLECLHHRREKARVQRIRQEWANQQKAGKLPRGQNLELPEQEAKFVASRLNIIDGSTKQTSK